MKDVVIQVNNLIDPLRMIAKKIGEPIFDLAIRLYIANIFFKSGKLRLDDYLNGQWDNQIEAFTEYHPIPGVPAEFAATAGTVGEIILPILLALGLFGRFGAAGLLVMTFSIQFLVPAEYGIANPEHYYWMFLLGAILIRGPGLLSIDTLLIKWIVKEG